jgi:hypothetical protein
MPIEFSCPGCRKVLRVADSAAGKKARCPDCSTVSDVPQASQSSGAAPDFSSFGPGSSPQGGAGDPSWSTGNWSPGPESSRPASNAPGGNAPTENPFGQQAAPHQSSADNPFASPQPNYKAPSGAGFAAVRERLKGPAISLIVVSGIGIALTLASVVFQLVAPGGALGQGMNNGGDGPGQLIMMLSFGIGPALVSLFRAGFVIYGALQMKNLENHSVAMATAIIAVVPCFSPCCLMDLPFGIWALVVLNDPQVKQAFQMSAANR